MKAVRFLGKGKFSVEDVPTPEVKEPNDVLIKVEAASICGTDLQILKVPPGHPANEGIVLGHEYTGKIVQVGQRVKSVSKGDRVVVDPNITCGSCNYCKRGMPNMCSEMTTLGIFIDGGFAEHNIAPEKALHKIPETLSPEWAVFAEPLSCVLNAVNKLKPFVGESVVILGAGPIGLLFTQVLAAAGVKPIIVSEVSDYRRKYAEKSGAHTIIDPQMENIKKRVHELTGIGADIVVDAVGSLFKDALELVRTSGRIMLFGQNENARADIQQYYITRREQQILGSYIANFTFPQAVALLDGGLLQVDKLITHRIKLEEFGKGLELLKKREAIKVVMTP